MDVYEKAANGELVLDEVEPLVVYSLEDFANKDVDYYNPDEIDWLSIPGNYARGILGFTDRDSFIALVEGHEYQTWLKTREHEMVHFPYANESRVRELTLTGPKYLAP